MLALDFMQNFVKINHENIFVFMFVVLQLI